MWVKSRPHKHWRAPGTGTGFMSSGMGCALSLIFVMLLSSGAFFLPQDYLLHLGAVEMGLVLHGLYRKSHLWALLRLIMVQLCVTLMLYYFIHGEQRLADGALVVLRLCMAMLPGWWLSNTQPPERLGEVLSWGLPAKWAFVIAASIGLLPYMTREIGEIYQIQCLRGARITARDLRKPSNWPELINCVLLPLLIQLLKLSKQMARAAELRHFGTEKRPSHWHLPRE